MPGTKAGSASLARDPEAELSVKKMLLACERDPQLQSQLLANPEAVAEKFHVTLSAEEKNQLQRVARLQSILDEYKAAREVYRFKHPIFYPIEIVWRREFLRHFQIDPLFYPVPDLETGRPRISRIRWPRPFPGYPIDIQISEIGNRLEILQDQMRELELLVQRHK